jgi:hypothetical protein
MAKTARRKPAKPKARKQRELRAAATEPATEKIDYAEFRRMLMDPSVPDAEIAAYLTVDESDSGPFDPRVVPDPQVVEMDGAERFEVESAIRWANGAARWRRATDFRNRMNDGVKLPVLVSEGDSWFQFPFFLEDLVDQLWSDHLIWSLDAAGDTAHNMVYGRAEYMKALQEQKKNKVQGFLFSAAGNDVIGEDEFGNPVLEGLIKTWTPGRDAAWHVDKARLAEILTFLEQAYRDVISTIRSDSAFAKLPIIIHGYDYALPGGYPGDTRDPRWATQDRWLAKPLNQKGIKNPTVQQGIIRVLIDALYDMLARVSGDSAVTRVFLVDLRKTLSKGDWADEIHPTNAGFAKVAKAFRKTLQQADVRKP